MRPKFIGFEITMKATLAARWLRCVCVCMYVCVRACVCVCVCVACIALGERVTRRIECERDS